MECLPAYVVQIAEVGLDERTMTCFPPTQDGQYRGRARAEAERRAGRERAGAGFALGSHSAFKPMFDGSVMRRGDPVLLDYEVPGVMAGLFGRLRSAGVEVTAIHQHHLGEEPRLFYMHFWANDELVRLAMPLRAALDLRNSSTPVAVAANK